MATTESKAKATFRRPHAQRGMQLMNMATHLTTLKDSYRRDLKQYLDQVKQAEAMDDHASVLAFMDAHDDFGKKEFAVMNDEAQTILDSLGGPVEDAAP